MKFEDLKIGQYVWWTRHGGDYGRDWNCPGIVVDIQTITDPVDRLYPEVQIQTYDDFKIGRAGKQTAEKELRVATAFEVKLYLKERILNKKIALLKVEAEKMKIEAGIEEIEDMIGKIDATFL